LQVNGYNVNLVNNMNVNPLNQALALGEIDRPGLWPRLEALEQRPFAFDIDFGLGELPVAPGIIVIRGARQFGKSTWLDTELKGTIEAFGKGSAFYLNGDDCADVNDLWNGLRDLDNSFAADAKIRRIFVDEITAVKGWEKAVKRLWDAGGIRKVLLVTTGSNARDLRRGSERLPGRKGQLLRTDFVFLPLSYASFASHARKRFKEKTWLAYMLSGGSPALALDLVQFGSIAPASLQVIRDWIMGDVVGTGRSRIFLTHLMRAFFRFGGTSVGYNKLARESGFANNTVAAGYVEQLSDLLAVLPAWAYEAEKKAFNLKKPARFHFVNLAVALAFSPLAIRSVGEFEALPNSDQSIWLEWFVAFHLWREANLQNVENPEKLGFWQSRDNEIDFVDAEGNFVEVKRGRAGPLDFGWFPRVFPGGTLTVISNSRFTTNSVTGLTFEDFISAGKVSGSSGRYPT